MIWRCSAGAELLSLMALWEWIALSLHCWVLAVAAVSDQHATSPFDWLLSDKGPFHRSQEYTDFVDRSRQGFSTRYKIYREFGRWKVNNLAVERRNFLGSPLPLAPEFFRNIRLLGRRPTLQQITENLIKKYGTHFLLSATLGGSLNVSLFVDYFTLVTETRTGPLGCSNYDNLDSVSSVLVQSPENKIQLQGLQVILPDYLQERFVQAALSYIACNSEGEFICKDNDCWCQCGLKFPECNCPYMDIQAMEENLLRISETWNAYNNDFEESDEFKLFMKRLPMNYFLNTSTIMHLWTMDSNFQRRYEQLENSMKQLFQKAQKIVHKLFSLSKRCHKQPLISLPRQRSSTYWLTRIQSFLYCNENGLLGSFSEETHSCTCPNDQVACHGFLPCTVGDGSSCLTCAPDNRTRCGNCNTGYMLSQGLCKPEVAESTEHYIGFETDLQDLEMKYLLQKTDRRIEVHAIFISNDMRLNSWFDPSWRKRMLLTLKSNKYKASLVHMILGLSLQICLTKNSTLEPVLAVYVNPFGGSHSESWFMPVNENSFPDWERTKLDLPLQCYNWTLTLGNKWKTFFETVHIYLRSRIKSNGPNGNESIYYEPLEFIDPSRNLGYMKINNIQVFGYSMHFDPEAIRDLILQLDYPYTQGSQDSALLQLLEIRDRVNKLSPPGQRRLDLFSCLLRHRLKLSTSEVVRIQSALQAFNSKLPNTMDYDTTKLCS
ncbi:BMP/retinoic acid-inducible neural-specific protein 3 [Gracilinanus agilis]|uniref:BMP/retinoic acid-inducible neural-specific protein 3 n=1 Tax=Gracilinanus agilis TaxID=191870 RepID=UPI001CFE5CF1|nr:BMP/retinoic acid-inducible neural-specific protein 3 [Gracilinanus agilis]